MNRLKILGAFETLPNVIEMAKIKSETFALDINNPKTVELHKCVHELQKTLLQTIPVLITKLVPGTFGRSSALCHFQWRLRPKG